MSRDPAQQKSNPVQVKEALYRFPADDKTALNAFQKTVEETNSVTFRQGQVSARILYSTGHGSDFNKPKVLEAVLKRLLQQNVRTVDMTFADSLQVLDRQADSLLRRSEEISREKCLASLKAETDGVLKANGNTLKHFSGKGMTITQTYWDQYLEQTCQGASGHTISPRPYMEALFAAMLELKLEGSESDQSMALASFLDSPAVSDLAELRLSITENLKASTSIRSLIKQLQATFIASAEFYTKLPNSRENKNIATYIEFELTHQKAELDEQALEAKRSELTTKHRTLSIERSKAYYRAELPIFMCDPLTSPDIKLFIYDKKFLPVYLALRGIMGILYGSDLFFEFSELNTDNSHNTGRPAYPPRGQTQAADSDSDSSTSSNDSNDSNASNDSNDSNASNASNASTKTEDHGVAPPASNPTTDTTEHHQTTASSTVSAAKHEMSANTGPAAPATGGHAPGVFRSPEKDSGSSSSSSDSDDELLDEQMRVLTVMTRKHRERKAKGKKVSSRPLSELWREVRVNAESSLPDSNCSAATLQSTIPLSH